jgi:hypothetical protein
MRRLFFARFLAASLVVTACADDPSAPEDVGALATDVAMVAADQTMHAVGGLHGLPGDGRDWMGDFARSVTYFDAEGNEQDAFDPLATDVIAIVVDISREASRDGWEAAFEHHKELEISGLAGEETSRTWNGTGETVVSRSHHSDGDGDRAYELTSSTLLEDVVVGVPRAEFPWPLSGAMTHMIEATRLGPDGEETRSWIVTVTFNGTRYPELTVGGDAFELDLGARDGDRPIRRGPRD